MIVSSSVCSIQKQPPSIQMNSMPVVGSIQVSPLVGIGGDPADEGHADHRHAKTRKTRTTRVFLMCTPENMSENDSREFQIRLTGKGSGNLPIFLQSINFFVFFY
jgi:hypothetical protein